MSETPKKKKAKPARKRITSPFAKNLRHVLSERNISLKAAAELASVSVSVLGDWSSGSMPHDLLAVQRLAKALKISFEWLVTGEVQTIEAREISLKDLFREEKAFAGIYRIEATKLVRREDVGEES